MNEKRKIKRKRIISFLLSVTIICNILFLAACHNGKAVTGEEVTPTVTQEVVVVTPTVTGTSTDANSSGLEEDGKGTDAVTSSVNYENTEYGFAFGLPGSWKNYTIVTDTWEGNLISDTDTTDAAESGPIISIRHPKWTKDNPRQDIPIMIFTYDQWTLIESEELAVSAAPIGPSELGRNSIYVFALPARYNFAYITGYEEVNQLITDNVFSVNENISKNK